MDQVKHPVDWFKWGADLRIREEFIANPFLLDRDPPGHEWNDLRIRSRAWGTITPWDGVDFNTRLTWEPRYWWTPVSKHNDNHDTPDGQQWMMNDVDFDNLNLRIKFKEFPATLTVGRQDIILGDGWLVLDGTPLDGSETIYMDLAARLSIDLKECQSSVNLIFIQNWSDPDTWLPSIDSKSRARVEQDEAGFIVWLTNKSIERTEINPYFMYKHDDAVLPNGDNGEIYTFGGRIKHEFNQNWNGRIEGGYQFGDKQNDVLFPAGGDVSAWGLISNLEYKFNDTWKNSLHAGYEVRSGDDPNTKTIEQWDPLWARWPMWSELYIYTYAVETRIAEVTNLHRINVGWAAQPTSKMGLSLDYHLLLAYDNSKAGTPGFSNSGDVRGHLFTGVLTYKFNKNMQGHLWAEYFIPGNYYKDVDGDSPLDTRQDPQAFLRWEIMFTF